jgi:hypothetical protein
MSGGSRNSRSSRCCWRWISPGRISYRSRSGSGSRSPGARFKVHVLDFLAAFGDGSWRLFDVRPAPLVKDDDATCFAAAEAAGAVGGRRYSVAAGWRPNARPNLDALSAQRRPLEDRLGLQDGLLRGVSRWPLAFGDQAAARRSPPSGDRPVSAAGRRRRRSGQPGETAYGRPGRAAGARAGAGGCGWTVRSGRWRPWRPSTGGCCSVAGGGGHATEHPVAGASSRLPGPSRTGPRSRRGCRASRRVWAT